LFGCVDTFSGKIVAKRADKGNARTFKSFLQKIIHEWIGKKIWLVLDNVRYHHANMLKPFLENNKDKLELIFLPPYSPDLNPMERVWWYMRKKITHNRAIEALKERIKKFWQMFSFFIKPNFEITKICNVTF